MLQPDSWQFRVPSHSSYAAAHAARLRPGPDGFYSKEDCRIFVIDSDTEALGSVARLVADEGYRVTAFTSCSRFLEGHAPRLPGCLLLDLNLAEQRGFDIQATLTNRGSQLPIISVTSDPALKSAVTAMKKGAHNYFVKPVDDGVLLAAIDSAVRDHGERLNRQIRKAEMESLWQVLSPREKEVFILTARGRMNKQIAFDLGITMKTVKVHRCRALAKMHIRSAAEAAHIGEHLFPVS